MGVWGFEGGLAGRLLRNVSALAAAFWQHRNTNVASPPTRAPSFDILSSLLLGAVWSWWKEERVLETWYPPVKSFSSLQGPKFGNFWVSSRVLSLPTLGCGPLVCVEELG